MHASLNLRQRLVILMVAAMLPLFGLSVWMALRESRSDIELAQAQLGVSAALLAANQDQAVAATEQLLGAVAAIPGLRSGGSTRCQGYFEDLRRRSPMYDNIGLLGRDGNLICHANPARGDPGRADRAYFQQAVAQRRLVMDEPIVARISGRRVIPLAVPVIESDQVTGVVFATLDVDHLATALTGTRLPDGARVLVADRHGHVLMEYPQRPDVPLPREVLDPRLREAARTMSAGVGEGVDRRGEARVYAFAPTRLVGDQGYLVRVGLPRAAVIAGASARLRDTLLVLGAVLLAAIAATAWLGGHFIVEPARQIVDAVRRLEHGQLDSRIPLRGGARGGEFWRISAAFNLMAESLQLRQLDLHTELGRSRRAYEVLDLVLNNMQEALLAVTAEGRFLFFNQAATRLFPLDDPALPPARWAEQLGFFHADGTTPYFTEELPLVRAALGEAGGRRLLVVRNDKVPQGRLLQCSWQPIQRDGHPAGGLVVFTDVTEVQRLQAEQEAQLAQLRETQRKLAETQRIGRVGNWELDLRSGRLWWSDEVYELFGLDKEQFDFTLAGIAERVHPQDRPLLKPARDSALRDGQVMSVEYRVVRPDGTIAWMHERGEARRDAQGEPVWFGGVVQDITARKQGEQALLQSERELQGYTLMLQRAAEAAQAITFQSSLEDTVREAAEQARRVIGARQAEVTLYGAGEGEVLTLGFSGPDGAGPVLGLPLAVPMANHSGQPVGELRLWGKQEGEFTQHDEYVALELAQLASIAIENVRLLQQVRDLNAGLETAIASRTAELTQQEQLYRTLAEQAPEVVWNTDATGTRLTFLNRAWYELVGGTPEDWLGKSGLAALHPDDRAEVSANWRRCRESLEYFTGVRRLRTRDGSYHTMSYKAAPVLDEQGQVAFWVGIDADITEFKAIEQALRVSNRELEAFSYSVSHDLRAPLGAIGGFGRALALKLEGHPDERVRHYLSRVQAGVEKMEHLIDALLSLAQVVRAPLAYGPVDLGAIARETLEGLQMQQPERRVDVQVQDGLVAQGDARLLRGVMENLLGNAWKFTAGVASARIEVGRLEGRNIFFVRDNGVGFDMAYADKLFAPFQRLHSEAEFAGTGIGLATVQRIVARHQGRVWAESRPAEGSTFFFALSESAPPAWLTAGA